VVFIESKLQQDYLTGMLFFLLDRECCQRSPYVSARGCDRLQLTRENRNDDCFAVCLQV